MKMLTYTPLPPLSELVDLLWWYEGGAQPHSRERVLPTGSMELIVNLHGDTLGPQDRQDTNQEDTFRGSLMCGAYSESFVIDTAQPTSLMGVHFKPGGAFPFLKLPAGELHNLHVPMNMLWGGKAGELRERLLEAKTPPARFRILEQSLAGQLVRGPGRHPAVAFALKAFQEVSPSRTIADVTEQVGLSARRFIEVFTAEVGLTPKLFCRVQRFQHAIRLLARKTEVDWVRVALGCGYYDQAHFIHEFRAFSGLNPTAYLRQKGEHLNHVPLVD